MTYNPHNPKRLRTFYSWGDYLAAIEDGGPPGPGTQSGKTYSAEWTGTPDWESALHLAHNGYTKALPTVTELVNRVEETVSAHTTQTGFDAVYGVAGAEVDVARYLADEPECMIESTPIRVSRHGRAVRLLIGASFLADVTNEAINLRGAAVVALADALAKAQHPLEIWWSNASSPGDHMSPEQDTKRFCQLVRIQAADDPLDVDRLLFCFAHPSSTRRIAFRGREKWVQWAKNGHTMGGTRKPDIRELPDAQEVENTIVLNPVTPSDRWTVDTAAEWVEEQLRRIFD